MKRLLTIMAMLTLANTARAETQTLAQFEQNYMEMCRNEGYTKTECEDEFAYFMNELYQRFSESNSESLAEFISEECAEIVEIEEI